MRRPAIAAPAWLDGRTWYHVYPLGALGCERESAHPGSSEARTHRLLALRDWLDHLVDLGVGGLLLGPVFASLRHGYDTVDPFRIDQRLGDEADLARLVEACHARDLAVLLDGVFNHVSRSFPAFDDVLEHGRASASRDWFRIDFEGRGPDGFAYESFEGHRDLVALNHRSEAVLDWAVAVANHWLDRGIDGWRLDASYAVLPSFWSAFAARVRERFPQALLVGEMIHGDYAGFVRSSGLHTVTQYELHKALWSAFNDRNLFELSWALERHEGFCQTFVPLTFAGNHDVTRILTRLRDPHHLGHVLAVLFTAPGSPCIYYGDELALRGTKEHRAGGDDAVRPALDPTVSRAGRDDEQTAVHALYRELVALRRDRPWLTSGRLRVGEVANERLRFDVTVDERTLRIALNPSSSPMTIPADGRSWHRVAGAAASPLPAGAWTVLEPG